MKHTKKIINFYCLWPVSESLACEIANVRVKAFCSRILCQKFWSSIKLRLRGIRLRVKCQLNAFVISCSCMFCFFCIFFLNKVWDSVKFSLVSKCFYKFKIEVKWTAKWRIFYIKKNILSFCLKLNGKTCSFDFKKCYSKKN